jgi:hypothetical protein
MILTFLRCFSQYRDLESDLDAAVLKTSAMEARAVEAESQIDIVPELRSEIASLQHDVSSLQEANQALETDKTVLQDRLESAIEEKTRIWATFQESLRGERYALQSMANVSVQKTGGGIPFPDAHSLPPNAVPKPQDAGPIGRSSRMLPSEIQDRNNREFIREYVGSMRVPKDGVVEVGS